MDRPSYRVPLVYFVTQFVALVVFLRWDELQEIWAPTEPLPADFYGFYDPLVRPSYLATLLHSSVIALSPAIGALAGIGLASNKVTPTWGRSALGALICVLPVAAVGGARVLIEKCIHGPSCPNSLGGALEAAQMVLAGIWLLLPPITTKLLYGASTK